MQRRTRLRGLSALIPQVRFELHLYNGAIFAIIFLLTGQYMRFTFPDAFQGDGAVRMMYRASHVYILLAALLNVAFGVMGRGRAGIMPSAPRWPNWLAQVAMWSVLLAPAVFTVSFFAEPAPGRLDRPIVTLGVVLSVLGVAGYALAMRWA